MYHSRPASTPRSAHQIIVGAINPAVRVVTGRKRAEHISEALKALRWPSTGTDKLHNCTTNHRILHERGGLKPMRPHIKWKHKVSPRHTWTSPSRPRLKQPGEEHSTWKERRHGLATGRQKTGTPFQHRSATANDGRPSNARLNISLCRPAQHKTFTDVKTRKKYILQTYDHQTEISHAL